jgi:hypothetical protein
MRFGLRRAERSAADFSHILMDLSIEEVKEETLKFRHNAAGAWPRLRTG